MLLLDQLISESEIQMFKNYFLDNFDKKWVNWKLDGNTIDHRLEIDAESPEFNIVRRIVETNFSNPIGIWSAYQRQVNPHSIHIDDYGSKNLDIFRYTYIIAMDTVPEFKAIVWKETCWNNDALHKFVHKWGNSRRFKKTLSNISEIEDLEHTYDVNQQSYLADYLTLDGIYSYKIGTGCLFNATQLHCTSNWTKYKKFSHRELLQIHVLNSIPIEC